MIGTRCCLFAQHARNARSLLSRGLEPSKFLSVSGLDPRSELSGGDKGHRIKIGGLGRMANSAFGGKLNLCGTCSHLFTMFMVYLVVDNKYNVYVR